MFPQKQSNYSYRNSTVLQSRSIKTVMHGSKTRTILEPKIYEILPTELKDIVSPTLFKKIVNGPQRIVYVLNLKLTDKALDFCKLPVRIYFAM